MLAYRYPIIAREGWLWIAISIIAALLVQWFFAWLALPLWALSAVLLYLFRDPQRRVPASPLGIVSPVDGRISSIETVEDQYLNRQAICIGIQMGITSVYSIHSPIEGKIAQTWYKVPSQIVAADGQASMAAETYAQWIQSDEADDVVLVVAARQGSGPQCYAHSGERVGQGQRCGFIRFGSPINLLLPVSSRIGVKVGDKVQAATDILASLVHAEVAPPQVNAATI
jgi:phosphatidylserine decarboxylase